MFVICVGGNLVLVHADLLEGSGSRVLGWRFGGWRRQDLSVELGVNQHVLRLEVPVHDAPAGEAANWVREVVEGYESRRTHNPKREAPGLITQKEKPANEREGRSGSTAGRRGGGIEGIAGFIVIKKEG